MDFIFLSPKAAPADEKDAVQALIAETMRLLARVERLGAAELHTLARNLDTLADYAEEWGGDGTAAAQ